MKIARTLGLIAIPLLIGACASNKAIVSRMEERSTGCDKSSIQVTELEQSFAGRSRYQTVGCGTTHNYVCGKWENIAMAGIGWINLDPRPCMRERR